jgi:hypothetical protein
MEQNQNDCCKEAKEILTDFKEELQRTVVPIAENIT